MAENAGSEDGITLQPGQVAEDTELEVAWPYLVAERLTQPRNECILLERRDEADPLLPASHWVTARGTRDWCEAWIQNNSQSTLSYRQYLAYLERDQAAHFQIIDNGGNGDVYDVPQGLTPDERSFEEGGFPRFAGSFHKLLEHDLTMQTGLLTEQRGECRDEGGNPHQQSGVYNYERLLRGLKIAEPSSDFDTAELNALELCNRNAPGGRRGRVLINPRSSKALSTKGPDITSLRVSRLLYGAEDEARLLQELSLGSEFTAAEIVENYAMALLRCAPFGTYSRWKDTELAVDALNAFGEKFVWGYDKDGQPISAANRPVSEINLFRGPSEGDRQGDYLSVFLTFLRAPLFPSGCASFVSDLIEAGKFAQILGEELLVALGIDQFFATTREHHIRIQNADIPQPYPDGFFTGRTPIRYGLDLGTYVHGDNVYEHIIRAADILTASQYDHSRQSPYTGDPRNPPPNPFYKNEGDGPTLGPPDAYALIGGVREVAERAAFAQKYLVARRARPEVMAGLVDLANRPEGELTEEARRLRAQVRERLAAHLVLPDNPAEDTEIQSKVRALLYRVREGNREQQGRWGLSAEDNFLLSQVYPEGSPAHPAWTSGHATVAGAGVTVLKAFFDDQQFIIDPTSPADNRRRYRAPSDNAELTVAGELDKLASNIAFGRNFAGVHYRTDGEHGIVLGEEVAIRYLQDHLREYREELRASDCREEGQCKGLTLTKRNGQRICITPDDVCEISATAEAPRAETTIFAKSVL